MLYTMVSVQRSARKEFRQAGMGRLGTLQAGRIFATSARGFHKSRVADTGFTLHDCNVWRTHLEAFRAGNSELAEVERRMSELRATFGDAIQAYSALSRSG